jgi:uncharacterized protein
MLFKYAILIALFIAAQIEGKMEEPWGKDTDLIPSRHKAAETFSKPGVAAKLANSVISFHQNFLSPTTGKRSSFRPSSSKYMELAIKRYGFLKGFIMGCDRLLRENNEEWVYRMVEIDGIKYKYDPAVCDKFQK